MTPVLTKKISSKIHDTTISDWANEIQTKKTESTFPNEIHWFILISISISIGILGLSLYLA
jgi:hypothetical protein